MSPTAPLRQRNLTIRADSAAARRVIFGMEIFALAMFLLLVGVIVVICVQDHKKKEEKEKEEREEREQI